MKKQSKGVITTCAPPPPCRIWSWSQIQWFFATPSLTPSLPSTGRIEWWYRKTQSCQQKAFLSSSHMDSLEKEASEAAHCRIMMAEDRRPNGQPMCRVWLKASLLCGTKCKSQQLGPPRSAHMSLGAQTGAHKSTQASLGAHTSTPTSLRVHTSACMYFFAPVAYLLLWGRGYSRLVYWWPFGRWTSNMRFTCIPWPFGTNEWPLPQVQ